MSFWDHAAVIGGALIVMATVARGVWKSVLYLWGKTLGQRLSRMDTKIDRLIEAQEQQEDKVKRHEEEMHSPWHRPEPNGNGLPRVRRHRRGLV